MTTPAFWGLELDQTQNWAYMNDVFTKEECQLIIDIGNQGLQKGLTIGDDESVRDSKIAWLYANDEMEWAFRKLTDVVTNLNNQFFKFDLTGFGEGFQFTKYESPTGHYGMHIDKILNGQVRKLSLTVQLSDPSDYEGGDLVIKLSDKEDVMEKTQGRVVLFPSYVLHEVKPVTQGTRYSLVSWLTGKPFK